MYPQLPPPSHLVLVLLVDPLELVEDVLDVLPILIDVAVDLERVVRRSLRRECL